MYALRNNERQKIWEQRALILQSGEWQSENALTLLYPGFMLLQF